MRKTIGLKKGLNLHLEGGLVSYDVSGFVCPSRVAVEPDDFPGFMPKLEVKEGDPVKVGSPLFHDKVHDGMKLVSPVSGIVESIVRGPRRKIERIVISVDSVSDVLSVLPFSGSNAGDVRDFLLKSGLWIMMRRRPFDVVPDPSDSPVSIMVTAMDTAPLALPLERMIEGRDSDIKAGLAILKKLTSGKIYIGVDEGSMLHDFGDAEVVRFPNLHPAGNAGVQLANIRPVNKGDVAWTVDILTVARIGRLAVSGVPDWETMVAVTGSEITDPSVIKTVVGAEMSVLLEGRIKSDEKPRRVISGNVLTGIPVGVDGYLRYPYRQVTVIPEGSDADEFMGWASMSPSKMSVNPSFIGHFLKRSFAPDARLNGGRRAMIMSGVYDKVFPMDILPEYLIKAILARDIDRMEALGIYEVAPEDFALAEYVDPSKLELQKIVRQGLDYLRGQV